MSTPGEDTWGSDGWHGAVMGGIGLLCANLPRSALQSPTEGSGGRWPAVSAAVSRGGVLSVEN